MPTTLGVGIVVVAAARGNEALALFLTLCTNILGILTIPFELKLVLQGSRSVAIDVLDLFAKLICTVLVPSLIGKVRSCLLFPYKNGRGS
jgi:sodium/bile acid cotransporter 7